ncbi:MAG: Acetyl-CoA synthetase, partial [uncultured Gemmatimonadetes bacterium]
QDALGQDHAPPPQGHRRGPHARRHHDARRPVCSRAPEGRLRKQGEL